MFAQVRESESRNHAIKTLVSLGSCTEYIRELRSDTRFRGATSFICYFQIPWLSHTLKSIKILFAGISPDGLRPDCSYRLSRTFDIWTTFLLVPDEFHTALCRVRSVACNVGSLFETLDIPRCTCGKKDPRIISRPLPTKLRFISRSRKRRNLWLAHRSLNPWTIQLLLFQLLGTFLLIFTTQGALETYAV